MNAVWNDELTGNFEGNALFPSDISTPTISLTATTAKPTPNAGTPDSVTDRGSPRSPAFAFVTSQGYHVDKQSQRPTGGIVSTYRVVALKRVSAWPGRQCRGLALNGGNDFSAHADWGCIHCFGYVLAHFKVAGQARLLVSDGNCHTSEYGDDICHGLHAVKPGKMGSVCGDIMCSRPQITVGTGTRRAGNVGYVTDVELRMSVLFYSILTSLSSRRVSGGSVK